MKWEGNRESNNVEGRREGSGGGASGRGWMFGISPITILNMLSRGGGAPALQVAQPGPSQRPPVDDHMGKFVSTLLADTEDVWKDLFTKGGVTYKEPRLVLFRGQTSAGGCGAGQAAMGPFYCPADQKVYIDLAFYETLTKRLGAPGDFAQAYVIAHEVGHHVQNLLGISGKIDQMRSRVSKTEYNALSSGLSYRQIALLACGHTMCKTSGKFCSSAMSRKP